MLYVSSLITRKMNGRILIDLGIKLISSGQGWMKGIGVFGFTVIFKL